MNLEWTKDLVHEVVEEQRAFFKTGQTLDVDWRIRQLKKLRTAVIAFEDELEEALYEDLGRCDTEAYVFDIGDVILEINEAIHGVRKWARPETHFSGLVCFQV